MLRGQCGFSKNVSSKPGAVKFAFFATFDIIIHIFSKNFIAIPQVVQKMWGQSILATFIYFHRVLLEGGVIT